MAGRERFLAQMFPFKPCLSPKEKNRECLLVIVVIQEMQTQIVRVPGAWCCKQRASDTSSEYLLRAAMGLLEPDYVLQWNSSKAIWRWVWALSIGIGLWGWLMSFPPGS